MIASPHNEKLKLVRKLRERKHREREGLFATEGEDLVEAGLAAGAEPRFLLTAAGQRGLGGEEVEPELLAAVSSLGSGTRAIAVWPLRWARARRGALRLPARGRRPRQRRRDRPHRPRAARRHRRARARLRRPLLAEGGAGEHGVDLRAAAGAGRGGGDAGAAGRPRRPRRRRPGGARRARRRSASAPSARGCRRRCSPSARRRRRSRCAPAAPSRSTSPPRRRSPAQRISSAAMPEAQPDA